VAMIQTANPQVIQSANQDFAPSRWWKLAAKRADLERSNLAHRGLGYLHERFRRAVEVTQARTLLKFDSLRTNGGTRPARTSVPYILEALGIEHDRAFDSYQPRSYGRKVVLFRASKQLPELSENRTLGWDAILRDNLTVFEIPGHQQNLLAQPNVTILAEKLIVTLETSQAPLQPELV